MEMRWTSSQHGKKRKRLADDRALCTLEGSFPPNDDLSDTARDSPGSEISITSSCSSQKDTNGAITPITPISTISTPRHPSDQNKVFQCTVTDCCKAFNRPAKLEQHLRSHTNTRPFVCSVGSCGKSFLRKSHLKHHVMSSHTSTRDYACSWEGCDKRFLTATRLRRHQAAHEGCERFKCSVQGCGQTFRKHSTLQAHVAKAHDGRKPFVCGFIAKNGKQCNAGFDTAFRLKDHEGRLHQARRYICSTCSASPVSEPDKDHGDRSNASFSTYSELQHHIFIEHPPTCSECGLKCATPRTLKSHVEVRHGNLTVKERRTFSCPKTGCSAGFTKKGNLNVHLHTIHGMSRYACNVQVVNENQRLDGSDNTGKCDAQFPSRAKLLAHVRNSHAEQPRQGSGDSNRAKRSQRKRGSVVERLTGPDTSSLELPNISCPLSLCQWASEHDTDLQGHSMTAHQLSQADSQSFAAVFADTVDEQHVRKSLTGTSTYATKEDLVAEQAFDTATHNRDTSDSGTRACYIGENTVLDHVTPSSWLDMESEMKRLME